MVVPFAEKENTGAGASWKGGDGGFWVELVGLKCCQDKLVKMLIKEDPVIQNTGSRGG